MNEKPKIGEWWKDSEGKRVYCVGEEVGGWPVVQSGSNLNYSTLGPAWKGVKLVGCTGWDWIEPKHTEPPNALTTKLVHLRSCIEHGDDEDALEHLFDLVRALRLRKTPLTELTPDGRELKALIE